MNSFLEYMNSKGKIDSPEVKVVADKVDCPEGRKYAPEQKGSGSAHPYSNGKTVKSNKEKGFGDQGHDNLKYNPCKNGKESSKAAKLPTAEQYDVFQNVRKIIQSEPTFMEQLVREFKRSGLMSVLVGEMITHKETFSHLAEVMANETYGPDICKKLARALNEDIAPPFAAKAAPEAPVDGEEVPEDELGDEEVPTDVPVDDEVPLDGEEVPEDEAGMDDMEMGPDGLPTAVPPDAGMPMRKPLLGKAPAMEHLMRALGMKLKG